MRWIDSIKKSIGFHLQELTKVINNENYWRSLIHKVAINGKNVTTTELTLEQDM